MPCPTTGVPTSNRKSEFFQGPFLSAFSHNDLILGSFGSAKNDRVTGDIHAYGGGDFIAARPPHALFSVAGNVPVSRTAALVERGFSGVGDSLHASLRRAHPRRRVDAAFRAAGLLGPPGSGRGRWRRGGG